MWMCHGMSVATLPSFADNRRKVEPPLGGHDPRTAVQLRSLSTVLKRLKEIMEGKSQVLLRGLYAKASRN